MAMTEPTRYIRELDHSTYSITKVGGFDSDIVEYWSDGECWFTDAILDGYINISYYPNSSRGSRSCFGAVHGREGDLVRLYAPLGKDDYIFIEERDPFRNYQRIHLIFETETIAHVIKHISPRFYIDQEYLKPDILQSNHDLRLRGYRLNEEARKWDILY